MPDQPVQPALSFSGFVLSLASTAAIHLGDLPDPATGARSEPNLEGAAQMIEILALLDVKTRGNLTAEERQILEQVLYELRLRFVEASTARQGQAPTGSSGDGGKRIIES
jgi:hypothetical protein